MQDLIDRNQIAGSIGMVARKGKVAYFKNFGLMDIEAKKPMRKDTIFRIASMSKPITSVAVMILFEEGYFLLNDPVGKYIPQFNKKLKVYTGEKNDTGFYMPKDKLTRFSASYRPNQDKSGLELADSP